MVKFVVPLLTFLVCCSKSFPQKKIILLKAFVKQQKELEIYYCKNLMFVNNRTEDFFNSNVRTFCSFRNFDDLS